MQEIFELRKKDFPELLKEIPDKPEKLYYRGELPDWEENKFLCVVGSRKYSEYGKSVCQKLISGLSGYPIVIVSGLALGIDGIAHEAALQAGLKTIAIPGSGLSDKVLYPPSNFGLAQKILKAGGALISEFEADTKAAPYMFPQRNRIMAGLSHATLIIEAEEMSGTLITARLAMEYNRDVLAIPGSIFSENTKGTHSLIGNGAALVTGSADILEVLELKEKERAESTPPDCSAEELAILNFLSEPTSRDDLLAKSGLSITNFNMAISGLEIKGLIKETLGKIHHI